MFGDQRRVNEIGFGVATCELPQRQDLGKWKPKQYSFSSMGLGTRNLNTKIFVSG